MIREVCETDFSRIREIFWLTSSKTIFENENKKNEFQFRYLDFYLLHKNFVGLVYEKNSKIQGYIIGLSQFDSDIIEVNNIYSDFIDIIPSTWGELHINIDPTFQGAGIGSELLKEYENLLYKKSVTGIFLLTSTLARNYSFYLKNNYLALHINSNNVVLLNKYLK